MSFLTTSYKMLASHCPATLPQMAAENKLHGHSQHTCLCCSFFFDSEWVGDPFTEALVILLVNTRRQWSSSQLYFLCRTSENNREERMFPNNDFLDLMDPYFAIGFAVLNVSVTPASKERS